MILASLFTRLLKLAVQQVKLLIDSGVSIFAAWRQRQLDILRGKAQRLQDVQLPVLQCTATDNHKA